MARGWESKSVEEQIASAESERASRIHETRTPEQIRRLRERDVLLLSRARVLKDLEASRAPRHRRILQAALADLDAKLARLG